MLMAFSMEDGGWRMGGLLVLSNAQKMASSVMCDVATQ